MLLLIGLALFFGWVSAFAAEPGECAPDQFFEAGPDGVISPDARQPEPDIVVSFVLADTEIAGCTFANGETYRLNDAPDPVVRNQPGLDEKWNENLIRRPLHPLLEFQEESQGAENVFDRALIEPT